MPSSKLPWIIAGVLALGLLATLVGWGAAVSARKAAEAEMEAAASAKAEAEAAAKRSAAAKSQVDADLFNLRAEHEQAAREVKELGEQKASLTAARAKLESYLGQQLKAVDEQKLPAEEDDVVQVPAKPARPGEWSVTPLLPAETIAAVTVCDAQQAIEKLKQTGLWRIYSDPDMQRAFRAPLLMAKAAIAAAEVQGEFKLDNILSFLSQGEITLALLALDKKTPQGQPLPELLVSMQARGAAAAVMDEITKRLDQLKAAAGGQLVVTQTPVGNTIINTVVVPVPDQAIGKISISYALCDGTIIAAFGEGRLEKLLAMREKYKGGVPKPGEGEAPEVLAQVPAYQKALEKGGPDASLIAYLNVEQVLKSKAVDVKPKTDRQRREWEAVGLDGVSAISYSVGIRKRGIREVAFIHVPAAKRHGLLGLVEGEGLGIDALGAAPRTAIAAVALKIPPERILDKLTELAMLDNPNAKEEINSWLLVAGQQLGNLDLKKEVFNALTGQATFSVSIATRHPKIPVGFPQPLLSLAVKDAAALKNILKA
ncbi:MAG: hypothetical protein NTW87_29645, partial [Planctomycetota bacterium]|nr:hypothetical protein [Planctomycetota bacterium]